MSNLLCDVCNVTVNTQDQLALHEKGKQHLKKLQQRQLRDSWSRAGAVAATGSASLPQTFWCDLCRISCSSPENLELHKRGQSHQTLLQQRSAPPTLPATALVPSSVRCNVCDVECNTFDQLANHEQGARHLKRVQQIKPAAPITTARPQLVNGVMQFRCDLCGIFCNTLDQLANHEKGEKHLKKLSAQGSQGSSEKAFNPTVGTPLRSKDDYMCTRCEEKFTTADQLRVHQCYAVSPPRQQQNPATSFQASLNAGLVMLQEGSREVHCRVCSTSCNTTDAMEVHLNGTRHQKNLKKMPREMLPNKQSLEADMKRLQIVDETGPVNNGDGLIECKVCCLKMNVNNAESHFKGKQHLQKLVKALRAPEHPVQRPAVNRKPQPQTSYTKTEPRKYQVEVFEKALFDDCVVFLPTGTGKTLVSAMVLARMLDANPNYQAVFLVEKTLLVLQQADYLREELQTPVKRLDWESKCQTERPPLIASVCGDLTDIGDASGNNRCLWQQDIIVTTVAFYLNLLKKEAIRWEDVCLVVFDEAHHCVKDHPFNCLLREYSLRRPQSLRPKVLGLTASPAGQSSEQETYQTMQQLLENMGKIHIAAVEMNKCELESFSSSCEISTCQDAADPTEQDLQRHLMSSAAEIFDIIMPKDYLRYTDGLRQELNGPQIHWDQVSKLTERLVDHAKKHDHVGAEIAEHCLQAFYELQAGGWALANQCIFNLQDVIKSRPSHLRALQSASKLNAAVDAAAVTHASGENISCVMNNLVELVVVGLQRSPQLAEGKAVVLVLTSQRSIARSVADYLESHIQEKLADVHVVSIVGHGSTSGQKVTKKLGARSQLTKGMTVVQQQKLLQKIQDLHFKVIVATSVAEEGVDLPSCGLVILLAPPSTMTALVQMRGRARMRESEFIVLTREAEQERKLEGLLAREQNMKQAVERILEEQKTSRW